jgi:hypothetical protein
MKHLNTFRITGLVALLAVASIHTRTSQAARARGAWACTSDTAGTTVGLSVRTSHPGPFVGGAGWTSREEALIVRGRLQRVTSDSLEVRTGGGSETFSRSEIEWMLVSCPAEHRRATSFASGVIAGGLGGAVLGVISVPDEPGPNGLVPNRGTEALLGGVRAGLAAGILAAAVMDSRTPRWVPVDPTALPVDLTPGANHREAGAGPRT